MLTLLEESAVRFQLELFIVRAPVGLGGRCPSSPSWSSLLPSSPLHTMMERRGGNIYWGRIFKGVNLSTDAFVLFHPNIHSLDLYLLNAY